MSSDLSMKVFRGSDGGLHPVLMYRGVPLVLPNLWVDDLSLTSRFNTQKAYLQDVLGLYRWAERVGVSIHESFASLRGLPRGALKSAAVSMCTRKDGERASQMTCTRKAQALRSFFNFGFDYFLSKKSLSFFDQRQCERNRDALLAKIDKQFVMRSRQGEQTTHTTELKEEQLASLERVLSPQSELNPFRDLGLRVRNYCIWRTMLATGARRAEIALLELDDLNLGEQPTITIRRPSPTAVNRRLDGANLKTEQRILPIRESLAELLATYVEDWRVRHIRPQHPSPALFLSARDGRRLFSSSINKVLSCAAACAAEVGLTQRVHPHCLRTTALNALSRKARDESGRLNSEFRDQLTYFAGWSPHSDMPLTYTREALSDALGALLRAKRKP